MAGMSVARPAVRVKQAVVVASSKWVSVRFEGYGMAGGAKRGKVRGLSESSLARLTKKLENPPVGEEWRAVIDLTYPGEFPRDGRVTKRQFHLFLKCLHWLCARQLEYVWVMEFQKRGAPHYHVLINWRVPHQWVAERWYGIVGSGDERHLEAGTSVREPRRVGSLQGYFIKRYMRKDSDQKRIPKGFRNPGRMWGASKGCGKELLREPLDAEAQGELAKRRVRQAAEVRSGRRLPEPVREGRHVGVTCRGGGVRFARQVVSEARELSRSSRKGPF